ncbi:MAG: hypothetical protein FWG98_10995 [Candidatus Cloacimonetes bacterium]|nr:hypothetical protein [Candidatus Cloacimonadota bacterium]
MKQLILIFKTEIYQLLQDKRLLIAISIYLFIFLSSLVMMIFSEVETPLFSKPSEETNKTILFFLFCLLSFSFCSLVTADITAGEKERNTLESLLMTQCPRYIIFWGKFLVGLFFSLIPFLIGLPVMFFLSISYNTAILVFSEIIRFILILIPFPFFITNLLIYNGFKAKTIRSAKSAELVIFLVIPFFSIALNSLVNIFPIIVYFTIVISLSYLFTIKTIKYLKSEKVLF